MEDNFGWASHLGHSLIKNVSIHMGPGKGWYWDECKVKKSTTKPTDDTICNRELKTFSYDKFRSVLAEEFDRQCSDEDIDNMFADEPETVYYIKEDYNVYDKRLCKGKKYHNGNVMHKVDQWDSEYLQIWDSMQNHKEKDLLPMIRYTDDSIN